MYEKVKRWMRDNNGGQDLSSWQYLAAAGGTKGLASLATYPHEVVRTRMRESASSRYQSMLQSIALIAKEEGRKGLESLATYPHGGNKRQGHRCREEK